MEEAKHIHAANLPFAEMPILLKNISQSLQGEKLTSGSKLLKAAIAKRDSNFVKKYVKWDFSSLSIQTHRSSD